MSNDLVSDPNPILVLLIALSIPIVLTVLILSVVDAYYKDYTVLRQSSYYIQGQCKKQEKMITKKDKNYKNYKNHKISLEERILCDLTSS